MFHYMIKVSTPNNFVLVCCDRFLKGGQVDPNHASKMLTTALTEPPDFPAVRVKYTCLCRSLYAPKTYSPTCQEYGGGRLV